MALAEVSELKSPAKAWVPSKKQLLIGGKWVDAKNGKTFDVENPATGDIVAQVADGKKEDIDQAVKAARKAFETGPWKDMSASERGKIVWKIGDAILKYGDELAELESLDNGKPLAVARAADVALSADIFHYMAGWATKIKGDTFEISTDHFYTPGQKYFSYTLKEPVGVVGQIIPWNFPLLMLAWKVAPALATGNTVVLKPAETTSLTALLFAELCEQAGIPDGVVNIITGDGTTGTLIVNHKDINKIAFTGSTQVGKSIQKSLAGRDVGLTLELGGKAANIVYEDAAIDQAVEGVVNGIFFNQGHVCCAGSRLLLQESIHDEFITKLEKRMQTLRVGNPLDKNTDIGAVNSKEQLNKIEELVNEGVSDGGKIFQTECELPGNGFWFKPTLFTDVQPSYSIAREEIFGPVLTTLTFRTPQEAIEIANNTEYGLSAGVWTEKGSKILWTADRLEAGVVWANTFNKFDPASPFGGYKESGFGREGGRHGLLSYLKAQS